MSPIWTERTSAASSTRRAISPASPTPKSNKRIEEMTPGQALARRLLFPVRPHINLSTFGAALGAYDFAGKRRNLGIVGILRNVDQALVAAGIVEAGGDQPLHAA